MVEEIQKKLQYEVDKLRQIQKGKETIVIFVKYISFYFIFFLNILILLITDYNKVLSQRQQLDGQLNENIMVKKELDLLKEDNDVFKLIGPKFYNLLYIIVAVSRVEYHKGFISYSKDGEVTENAKSGKSEK